ncbi:MAG TPA: hypothetical protein VEG84_00860, partial [Thermoanaerobaculia bacterium]|nr:hypothetical protein [Thermoanaerobaculia bacterium]
WDAALEHSRQAERMDPRGVGNMRNLGDVLLLTRRWSEARQVYDRALALVPDNLEIIESRAVTFLGEGDLAGARVYLKEAQSRVDAAALVAYLAINRDYVWVLDRGQTALLRSLTPAPFDDDEGQWAICQAQACAFAGEAAGVRDYAERARKAYESRIPATPEDVNLLTSHALALAYLGRKEEAIREAEHAYTLWPLERDATSGAYVRHQLARVYILAGEQEKAIDLLQTLLKIPYYLSPGLLKIDPNFDPLRRNPRFEKLVAGK